MKPGPSTVWTSAWVVSFVLLTSPSLLAIRPVIIMFYGGSLKQPVFIVNLAETMVFHDLENPTTIVASDLVTREYVTVAMFWGTRWEPYVSGLQPLTALRPELASQHGRFYPADGDRPAVLLQTKPQLEQRPVPTDVAELTWGGEMDRTWAEFLVRKGVGSAAGMGSTGDRPPNLALHQTATGAVVAGRW